MSQGTHGREGSSVGSLVAVCEARCGLATEDTSKFVVHNILHKILVFFGILFLANSRRNTDDVEFASLNGSVSMTRSQAPFRCTASMESTCQFSSPHSPQLTQVNQVSPTKIEQKAPQLQRKFGNRIAVGLCLPGSRYGSPSSKMG